MIAAAVTGPSASPGDFSEIAAGKVAPVFRQTLPFAPK